MAVRIRLRRTGTKKKPSYRIVVADSRFPRDGRFIEILGHYNPRSNPVLLEINQDKAKGWLKNGALPSEAVHKLFARKGLMEAPVFQGPPRKPKKEKSENAEKPAAQPATPQPA